MSWYNHQNQEGVVRTLNRDDILSQFPDIISPELQTEVSHWPDYCDIIETKDNGDSGKWHFRCNENILAATENTLADAIRGGNNKLNFYRQIHETQENDTRSDLDNYSDDIITQTR